jgi:hypothetical protein
MVNNTISIAISSALASGIATIVGNPLEVVKIRQQTEALAKCHEPNLKRIPLPFQKQLKFLQSFLARI